MAADGQSRPVTEVEVVQPTDGRARVTVRLWDRFCKFAPNFSALIPVLSFFGGILAALITTGTGLISQHNSAKDAAEQEWRDAVEKVDLNAAQIPSAFVLDAFDDDQAHRSQARKLEVRLLRDADPQDFDTVFGNLVANSRTAEDFGDVMLVGENLTADLEALCMKAKQQIDCSASDWASMVLKPSLFFDRADDRKTAVRLIWKLDSFGDEMSQQSFGKHWWQFSRDPAAESGVVKNAFADVVALNDSGSHLAKRWPLKGQFVSCMAVYLPTTRSYDCEPNSVGETDGDDQVTGR